MFNIITVKLQNKHVIISHQFVNVCARQNVNSRAMCGFQLLLELTPG